IAPFRPIFGLRDKTLGLAGVWQIAPFRPIFGLRDKTLGLAGFGNIARAVAYRAKAFGIHVQGYDPFVSEEIFEQEGVKQASWESLLQTSDMISIHLPLHASTRHVFNKMALEQMRSHAVLINTSRGGVIEETDLYHALKSKRIAGAALDVTEEEPLSLESPLLKLDNCIITSHCAWYSEESMARLQRFAALEISRLFSGELPKHIVNGKEIAMR
ncbi:NAD(P)-dependent oxidoreductase, partial [Paenibacillus koleovorans]|uniref:NAD(P)-dependent oxidoreductase n=1 Tax=Paenibacillus koleovorans TaxID=121608 RepID=UPI001FEA1184